MTAILKICIGTFFLEPKGQLTQNLSGNQVSDIGPSCPLVLISQFVIIMHVSHCMEGLFFSVTAKLFR